jgi:hypothetical protein
MKLLAFLILLCSSCILVAQPGDILGPGTYCRPLHQDVWQCRDTYDRPHRCVWDGGRWRCWRTPYWY